MSRKNRKRAEESKKKLAEIEHQNKAELETYASELLQKGIKLIPNFII